MTTSEQSETDQALPAGTEAEPAEEPAATGPSGTARRTLLFGLAAGALGGAGAEFAVHDLHPVGWIADRLNQQEGVVRMHGGDDSNQARANTLAVWNVTPATARAGRAAHYSSVGSSSNDQVDIVRNKLAAPYPETDLVVIDPEYLPGLVDDHLVAGLPDGDGLVRTLEDEGCFDSLVARCRTEDDPHAPLHALPLNADAPLLVIDLTLFPQMARTGMVGELQKLRNAGRPADFWLRVQTYVKTVIGPPVSRRILVQTGPYEGMTVSLVELLNAFGADLMADPTLRTAAGRRALDTVRRQFPPAMFSLPAEGAGDETATLTAVRAHRAAFARLWPSQWLELVVGTAAEEGGAASYAAVPIPRGVLGGQVVAVARNSHARNAATDLATFLARGQSQSQLFHVGGYVPTLSPFFADSGVRAQLPGLASALNSAVQRPYIRRYGAWSTAFREQVRPYLLGQDVDVSTTITQVLRGFVED